MINICRVELMKDYERAESSGASPSFQVMNITGYSENDEEINLLRFIDQGDFYEEENKVLEDLKQNCCEYTFNDCEIEIV